MADMAGTVETESYTVNCGTLSDGMVCVELHRKTGENRSVEMIFLTLDEAVVVARLLTEEVGSPASASQ